MQPVLVFKPLSLADQNILVQCTLASASFLLQPELFYSIDGHAWSTMERLQGCTRLALPNATHGDPQLQVINNKRDSRRRGATISESSLAAAAGKADPLGCIIARKTTHK